MDALGVRGEMMSEKAIKAATAKATVVKKPKTFWARTRDECIFASVDRRSRNRCCRDIGCGTRLVKLRLSRYVKEPQELQHGMLLLTWILLWKLLLRRRRALVFAGMVIAIRFGQPMPSLGTDLGAVSRSEPWDPRNAGVSFMSLLHVGTDS